MQNRTTTTCAAWRNFIYGLFAVTALCALGEPVDYVNPFVGTAARGDTYPGPVWPLGMVQPGPDTGDRYWSCCQGYNFAHNTVMGFSQTHLSGTGCPDFQDVALLPFTGDVSADVEAYKKWALVECKKAFANKKGVPRKAVIRGRMDKRTETAEPGYYAVTLTNWGVRAELTCSPRVAYHRCTFERGRDAHIYVNLQSGPQGWWKNPPPDRISEHRSAWDVENGLLSGYSCITAWAVDASLADRGPVYDKCGYFPWDIHPRSVAVTLEWCLDDWCAARLAQKLGKSDRAAFYSRRADYWKNLFDPWTGYMRGKDAKGNWHEPFNPYRQRPAPGQVHDYVEGSAIQYIFHVMQDPEGLIAAFGGQKPFYRALDAFFTLPSKMPGQNTTGECTGTIGQYAHGNEPSHHVAYFFPYVGRGDRTAEIVREVCDKYYLNKPNGLVGNDDCGQMSAWFVFACLGFYSFNPCGGEYVVGPSHRHRLRLQTRPEAQMAFFRSHRCYCLL